MKAVHAAFLFAALAGVAVCLFEKKNIFVEIALPWTEAQKHCRENYADMTTAKSKGEVIQLKNVGSSLIKSWIGLSKNPGETVYTRWSDGTEKTFELWGADEPNDIANSHCVFVYDNEFHDDNCSAPMMFFCYVWVPEIIIVDEVMVWEEAMQHCRNHHSDLVSMSTEDDVLAVSRSLVNQTTGVWTGLCFMDDLWFWVNQESLMNMASIPSCPAKPFRCGAASPGAELKNQDCASKKKFLCY